jgi:hypothetical protein
MERIRIPNIIIKILNQLTTTRSNRVITFHGLTDSFNPKMGIEQGDSLSPLLWRIYYDPLLKRIDKLKEGYTMEVMKYGDLRLDQEKKNILKVNSVAYMDDTTYIAKDKKQLERILKK